ncbi:helix-turn-helix transcriptional regulator [Herbaspirillum sp. AP02]|uniref:helix-turn-helix domain-containing protein n=1 Tax=unclassified Herbaspirillum TaxID=2624150 RepID=UPI0015DA0362|nr:helix-turn-helix transcriptional regulator [Herbaspirillum sp. AP02]NZD66300.1 helix-turn-helix transcriptional regulator [Herbaspirillum sp. AP21]
MSNDIAVRIGRNIAEARKARGRTQAEVAEAVGMDTVSLSRIERGVVTAGVPTLDRIAAELSVPLGGLFDGVSANSSTLADSIIAQLVPLHDEDRLFLMEQLQVWAKQLAKRRK